MQNVPAICFSIFGSFCRRARYGCKSTQGHQHTFLDASNLAYLSRYSKLMNTASFTQPIPAAFWHSVSTVQWASHIQPWPSLHTLLHGYTQSTPTADTDILWLHKGLHSQDCLLIIICEPCNSHYCSPVNHSKLLWEICCPFCSLDKSPPPSHELATDWNGYEHWNNI